jgi:hypothetical protein
MSSEKRLRAFHSSYFSSVSFGEMRADPSFSDDVWHDEFRWLEKQIGFYPLFMAFGNNYAIENTFYKGPESRGVHWRKHTVLSIFELDALADVVFTDYDVWTHSCSEDMPRFSAATARLTKRQRKWVDALFKPSWTREQWLQKASEDCTSVQLLVPSLDFRRASEIWTRGSRLQARLHASGLPNVRVRKVDAPTWWDEDLINE